MAANRAFCSMLWQRRSGRRLAGANVRATAGRKLHELSGFTLSYYMIPTGAASFLDRAATCSFAVHRCASGSFIFHCVARYRGRQRGHRRRWRVTYWITSSAYRDLRAVGHLVGHFAVTCGSCELVTLAVDFPGAAKPSGASQGAAETNASRFIWGLRSLSKPDM